MIKEEISKLYFENEKLVNLVPDKLLKWATKVMEENWDNAKDDESRKKVEYKIYHTLAVIQAGWDIMTQIKSVELDKSTGTIVCLFHDIGRFPQAAKSNSYIDEVSGMDHAQVGAEMIKKENFLIDNIEEIIEAVYWHSRKEYLGENIYAKFVRDADKTALYRRYAAMETIDTNSYGLKGNEIRESYLNVILNKSKFSNKDFKTLAEWYVYNSSWMWDINFEETKQIWRDEKYPEMLLNRFKKIGVDSKHLELIEKVISSF